MVVWLLLLVFLINQLVHSRILVIHLLMKEIGTILIQLFISMMMVKLTYTSVIQNLDMFF
eukprot:jgi/Orpsp1_1/1184266/evm.model.c7180000088788.1